MTCEYRDRVTKYLNGETEQVENDWTKMALKEGLVKGKDFMLVSSEIWYLHLLRRDKLKPQDEDEDEDEDKEKSKKKSRWDYKAAPVIRLMALAATQTGRRSLVESPNKTHTLVHFILKKDGKETRNRVLISLNTTCRVLHTFLSKPYLPDESTLRYYKTYLSDIDAPLPSNDTLLHDAGVRVYSVLKVEVKSAVAKKAEEDKKKAREERRRGAETKDLSGKGKGEGGRKRSGKEGAGGGKGKATTAEGEGEMEVGEGDDEEAAGEKNEEENEESDGKKGQAKLEEINMEGMVPTSEEGQGKSAALKAAE